MPHPSSPSQRLSRPDRAEAVRRLLHDLAPARSVDRLPRMAVGGVLAHEVVTRTPLPEHAVSLRDGYAVLARDTQSATAEHPVTLPIQGRLTADAQAHAPLGEHRTIRVLTGAPLPPGADAVIPEENVHRADLPPGNDACKAIHITDPVVPGLHVLPLGADLPVDSRACRIGETITPACAALLTRAKVPEVSIHDQPLGAMFALGDELQPPERFDGLHSDQPQPDGIPADNTVLVPHLLRSWGMPIESQGIFKDSLPAITKHLAMLAHQNSQLRLVVSTGGTGKSERDHIRQAARDAGFTFLFHGLNARPGKSAFAARLSRQDGHDLTLLGLPGPPPAVFALLHALALPLIHALCGIAPPSRYAALDREITTRPGPEWLVPCTLRHEGAVRVAHPLLGPRMPSYLALARADAVLALPPDAHLPAGTEVEIFQG